MILLAGGDLYDVLMQGKQDAANLRRELEEKGIGSDKIKSILYQIEPLRLAHRLDPDRTWMFSALFDDVVPLRNCDKLATAARLPESHHKKNARHTLFRRDLPAYGLARHARHHESIVLRCLRCLAITFNARQPQSPDNASNSGIASPGRGYVGPLGLICASGPVQLVAA